MGVSKKSDKLPSHTESVTMNQEAIQRVDRFLQEKWLSDLRLDFPQKESINMFLSSGTDGITALRVEDRIPYLVLKSEKSEYLFLRLDGSGASIMGKNIADLLAQVHPESKAAIAERIWAVGPIEETTIEEKNVAKEQAAQEVASLRQETETVSSRQDSRVDSKDVGSSNPPTSVESKESTLGFDMSQMDPETLEAIRKAGAVVKQESDGIHIKAQDGYGIFVNIHPDDNYRSDRDYYTRKPIWKEFVIAPDTKSVQMASSRFRDSTIYGRVEDLFEQFKNGPAEIDGGEKRPNTFRIRKISEYEEADYIREEEAIIDHPGFQLVTMKHDLKRPKAIIIDGVRAEIYRTKRQQTAPINDKTETAIANAVLPEEIKAAYSHGSIGKTTGIHFWLPDKNTTALVYGLSENNPQIVFHNTHEYYQEDGTLVTALSEKPSLHSKEVKVRMLSLKKWERTRVAEYAFTRGDTQYFELHGRKTMVAFRWNIDGNPDIRYIDTETIQTADDAELKVTVEKLSLDERGGKPLSLSVKRGGASTPAEFVFQNEDGNAKYFRSPENGQKIALMGFPGNNPTIRYMA